MVKKLVLLLLGLFSLTTVLSCRAEAVPLSASGIFAVSPTKNEIRLTPGESIIKNIYLTNQLGHDADFKIEIEDVSGTKDLNQVLVYYGAGLGPYSIKNYVVAGDNVVSVPNGGTKAVPIMISLPRNAKPGGFYGGVFFMSSQNHHVSLKPGYRPVC